MNSTPALHWTAYLTALLTPVVAIAAVWVAIMNARTARNKLKLDLFERRMKVLSTIRDVIRMTFEYEESVVPSTYSELVSAINDAEWVFSKAVHEHLVKTSLHLYNEYVRVRSMVRSVKFKMSNKSLSVEEGNKELQLLAESENSARKALLADEENILTLLAPYLRLSH